ncbi:MAG: extracellular solute-binding protein [Chloroflexi bacterium]|nr:extracellular solute-binding protein [Chloroflexota bacterium]
MSGKRLTRREFLYALGGAAAGTALAGCSPAAPQVVRETVEVQVESVVEVEKEVEVERVVTATPGPAEDVEIMYTTWRPLPEQELVSRMVEESFNETHPNISVQVIGAAYGEYHAKIVTMAAAGTPLDVIHTNSLWLAAWTHEGLLVDLTPFLETSDIGDESKYWPGVFRFVEYGAGRFSLPFAISVMALYYNTDIFDEVGYEYPNESWGPEGMLDAAQAFVDAGYLGNMKYSYTNTEWLISWLGGKMTDDDWAPTRCALTEPEAIAAMEWGANWNSTGAVTEDGTEFYQKRAAMQLMWGSQVVPNRMNMQDDNWDLFPTTLLSSIPIEEQHPKLGMHTQSIGAATRHLEASWSFLEWLYTGYQPIWAREQGYAVPCLKDVALSDDYLRADLPPKNMRALVDMVDGKDLRPYYNHRTFEEAMGYCFPEWDQVLNGHTSASEAHERLCPLIDQLLAEDA